MDRERLKRIRNFQSQDWYPSLVIRPLTILIMLVIADVRALTPNRLTTLANLFKVGACVVLVPAWAAAFGLDSDAAAIWAVVLLHLGILFDHLDGTMARYLRNFTIFGSFYDKVSDFITWFAICMALGWRAYVHTGDALMIVLATGSAAALAVRGYMKWLSVGESEKLRWLEAAADPAGAVARRTKPPTISEPPTRTAGDWLKFVASRMWRIVQFEEMDLFFWASLALIIDRLDLLCWLLFLTQGAASAALVIYRHLEADKMDATLRTLRARVAGGT